MVATNAVRLRAQADISLPRQRMARMFQHLPEWRAAVTARADRRAHVEMGIDVDDANRSFKRGVTEIVPERGLVAAAQHNRQRTGGQHARDDFPKGSLSRFEIAVDPNVAGVQGWARCQIRLAQRVPSGETV